MLIVLGTSTQAARESWTAPQAPFRIYGNSYYVGSEGLAAILITSDQGHILIDVPMRENVETIAANIRALGFRPEDIRLILNTHAHFDHAGGIAEMARISQATVRASPAQARALRAGGDDEADPQHGSASTFEALAEVVEFAAGQTLHLGELALQPHATPGHTPGSTSWSWRSCEDQHCLELVYADSLTALASGDYRYSDPAQPQRLADFRLGLQQLGKLPCDLLITPHPEASGFWERKQRRDAGDQDALIDPMACRSYADQALASLDRVVASERDSAASMDAK